MRAYHILYNTIQSYPTIPLTDRSTGTETMADTSDGTGHRAIPQSPLANGGATMANMNGKRLPRPKRIPSISQDDENDGDGEASHDDHNGSSRSLDTTSTTSTAVHCSDTQRSFAMSHRILPVDASYGDSGIRPPRTSRRSARFSRTANRLTKSLSTPIMRTETALDEICRPERRSNRERYNARGRLDYFPLLSERRSLSPGTRDSAPFRIRDRRRPSRLARAGSRSFSLRDAADDGSKSGGEEHSHSGGNEELYDKMLASIAARFTRRATLPENIKPMQDDHESDIMDPNAMRYLPKILRDIYAQRQRRRPSQIGEARLASIDLRLRLQRPEHLPQDQDIRGSILILDLSGFTALGERLRMELGPRDGAAEFASRVNHTLSTMVRQVYKYWGDVLMFAGDALICLFEERDDGEIIWDEMGERTLNNEEKARRRVRECCLSVLGKIATETDFTIHGGAAHGTIRCFFLGTPSKIPGRCAFVVSGHPLKQTGQLLNKAGKGEVYIDGEDDPISQKEGVAFITQHECEDEEEDFDMSLTNVVPRESARLMEQEASLESIGEFEVNSHARAYLRTLAARRCDAGSQNAMSMLLNELRPVAIVFVGLHDLDDIDPRDSSLLQLMNEAFKILSRITQACNGAVRDMLFDDKGCVFISVFGAHSHEVNPCFDATVSAMRMESALKDLKLNRFSLGVSFGECFCGEVGPPVRSDYVVMGPEVNMAARLMGKAPNRGTLVSKRIFTHSKKFIRFIKSEEIQVKGKDGFFHAYIPQTRIERQSLEIAEPQQPFVIMPSRQNAMDSLMSVKERAQNREPTIAFVSGGPFLGKSRLIDEVATQASNDGFRVLKSFRTSLDSFTSYFPLRQIVSEAMITCANLKADGESTLDSEAAAANYLVNGNIFNKTDRVNIGSIVPSVADAQLLSLLSGLNPKARTRSIADSLMKILTLLQPLIIILEGDGDIDPSSWSLLAELMQRARVECPQIILIVSSRDSPTITSAAANLRRNAIQIKLMPFEKHETELYLRVMLGIKSNEVAIDPRLLDVVHDRSNGCPLFIDCVVKWAVEKQMIEYVDCVDGSKKMSLKMIDERSDDVTAAIPRELSSILLAPFNHLPPPLWDALKIASCIGYSFDAELYNSLNQVLDFMPKIRELAEKHECFESNGSHFRWKQQAVYEAVKSLLMVNQRQKIHRMIVRAFKDNKVDLESEDMKRGDVHRLLGRHCALAEDWNGAFEQYMHAGDRAKATFNFNEASKMYEEAIDFQAKMSEPPPLRSRIIPSINLGTCLRELARYKEAEAVLTRCLNEAQSVNSGVTLDEQLYVRALTALAALYQAQSKYAAARKLYEKAVPIAQNIQESKSSLWLAENIAGYAETLRKSGDLPQAESHHREALEIRTRAVEEKSCTELELAVSYTQLGCTLAGMRQYKEAYEQHRLALKLRYRYLDFAHGLVSESLNYCAESLCALGRGGEGIPLALHAVDIRKNVFGESHPAYAHALSVLASCYHAVGRSFDARDCLEKCLEICEIAFQKNHANLIPNLMNYGNVLRATGDLAKAREVYERAIAIHQLNFKEGQQANQLEKCRSEVSDLTEKLEHSVTLSSPPEQPAHGGIITLAPADIESDGTPVIVFTDIGRDVDDELALVLISSLRRIHILNPIAVIATLTPQRDRAYLARGSMDAVGMADVPVGIGSSGGLSEDMEVEVYDAEYSRASPCIYESGMDLVYKALESVPFKSAQLLCMASLTDVATLIREREELFTSKVKEVILMGGVVSLESETLTPDSAYNNNCDLASARFVYKKCQELRVPTATLSRWAAYGCPIPPKLLDDLSRTDHMVSSNIRSVSKLGVDHLWNKVILHPSDPRREMLPSRCDISWFCRVFMGKKDIIREWTSSVWSHVTKLNMYDPLAVLLCVPAYRSSHFSWQTKVVNETPHIVVGTSELDTGIPNRLSLYNEYSSLFFSAFLESLHK
ncbi:hypothetical protein HJC23_011586 [Cyclotella cryptica]|uniref:Guanylate cyclase domain-containing protein n=1 Tax=Cyclotella cryptica TaxID=29204 RepID=A0ABD3QS10_9STRA